MKSVYYNKQWTLLHDFPWLRFCRSECACCRWRELVGQWLAKSTGPWASDFSNLLAPWASGPNCLMSRPVTMYFINLFPLIPACTARPGLPLSPPETAFLESPYYRPQTASIGDRHHPTNFHSVTYTQTDDAAFEAGSDNDHKSFLRMRVIFKEEYPAELFRFRRVLDDILSSFDVF